MKDTEMKKVHSSTHLGIIRSSSMRETREENIEENIKKARRTVYSLMASGLHGHNGLDPETNLHLIRTYITPVLLYGLELIIPNQTLINKLETFQKKLLKQILSIPMNSSDVAVYILSGFLPIEAQIHKKVLIMFNNVCRQNPDSVEKLLAARQISIKTMKSNSWFIEVKKILWKYQLNDISEYLEIPISKRRWKSLVDKAVDSYWTGELCSTKQYYKSLKYLNCQTYKPGKVHPILGMEIQSTKDKTRIPTKLKFLCGAYVLQSNRHEFNKNFTNPTCLLCKKDDENLNHFILKCEELSHIRDPILKDICKELTLVHSVNFAALSETDQIQILLDCSTLLVRPNIRHHQKYQRLSTVEFHTRRLLHSLYGTRYKMLLKNK